MEDDGTAIWARVCLIGCAILAVAVYFMERSPQTDLIFVIVMLFLTVAAVA